MLIPDHETEVDFLNCEAISRTVVDLLKSNRSRALTIGIHGDWGAGKSSILKMVQRDLAEDKAVACLWFNGWAYQILDCERLSPVGKEVVDPVGVRDDADERRGALRDASESVDVDRRSASHPDAPELR